MDIPVADVYQTLQSTMGSLYVNDFNLNGRTYRVQLQADGAYRAQPDDLGKVYVRSAAGAVVPVGTLIKVKQIVGAEQLERFNGFLAAKVLGNSIPKVSTGDAIRIVEEVARETLPAGYELAWTSQAASGEAHRHHLGDRFRLRHHHGLPDPRRPVREVVAAAGGDHVRC